jgi:hypothetical protein
MMNIMTDVMMRPFTASQSRANRSFGSILCGAMSEPAMGTMTVEVAITV